MKIHPKIKYVGIVFKIPTSIFFSNNLLTIKHNNIIGYYVIDKKCEIIETKLKFIERNLENGNWKQVNENTST